jgi:hypothetical protein
MKSHRVKHSTVVVALVLLLCSPLRLRAQGLGNLVPKVGQATSALTGDQQSLANKALCSALGSRVSNPASASPSLLSSPGVMSVAASSFAGSTKLPLPGATELLKGYVAEHATDILASCAVSNATGGLVNKIPGASDMPSMPK